MELPAPATGTITEILFEEGATVTVGQVIARMTAGAADGAAPAPRRPQRRAAIRSQPSSSAPGPVGRGRDNATPIAQRVAAAEGVDLSRVAGTARGGGSPRTTCWPPPTARRGDRRASSGSAADQGRRAALVRYMEESRQLPTATSFRTLTVTALDGAPEPAQGGWPPSLVHAPDRVRDRSSGHRRNACDGTSLPERRRGLVSGRRRRGEPRPRGRRREEGRDQDPDGARDPRGRPARLPPASSTPTTGSSRRPAPTRSPPMT